MFLVISVWPKHSWWGHFLKSRQTQNKKGPSFVRSRNLTLCFSVFLIGQCDPHSDGPLHWHWHRCSTDGDVFCAWLPNCQIHSGHRLHCRTDSQFVGLSLPNAENHLCHGWRWFALQVIKNEITGLSNDLWCSVMCLSPLCCKWLKWHLNIILCWRRKLLPLCSLKRNAT